MRHLSFTDEKLQLFDTPLRHDDKSWQLQKINEFKKYTFYYNRYLQELYIQLLES